MRAAGLDPPRLRLSGVPFRQGTGPSTPGMTSVPLLGVKGRAIVTEQHHEPGDTADDHAVRRVDEVTGALEQLGDVLAQEEDLGVILNRVCQQAVHAIPEADLASVSLLRDGDPYTAAMTDEQAYEIDKAQYRAAEGPCLESAKTGRLVRVTVAEARKRWPDFAEAAATAEVASYLSAPLFIDREYHGSLNLYGEGPHGFGKLDAALLELYTVAAEAALRSARQYLQARTTVDHLRQALTSRAVIDQAKGILMAVHRVPADDAFALLVERSQRDNVKVREIAEQFIADILRTEL